MHGITTGDQHVQQPTGERGCHNVYDEAVGVNILLPALCDNDWASSRSTIAVGQTPSVRTSSLPAHGPKQKRWRYTFLCGVCCVMGSRYRYQFWAKTYPVDGELLHQGAAKYRWNVVFLRKKFVRWVYLSNEKQNSVHNVKAQKQ